MKFKIELQNSNSILTNQTLYDTIYLANSKYKIQNQKGATKLETKNIFSKLIWQTNAEEEYGGYWYCSVCGAIYRQPKNWKPYASYCMRCHSEWEERNEE